MIPTYAQEQFAQGLLLRIQKTGHLGVRKFETRLLSIVDKAEMSKWISDALTFLQETKEEAAR